jgi:hypothetical protein
MSGKTPPTQISTLCKLTYIPCLATEASNPDVIPASGLENCVIIVIYYIFHSIAGGVEDKSVIVHKRWIIRVPRWPEIAQESPLLPQ